MVKRAELEPVREPVAVDNSQVYCAAWSSLAAFAQGAPLGTTANIRNFFSERGG